MIYIIYITYHDIYIDRNEAGKDLVISPSEYFSAKLYQI